MNALLFRTGGAAARHPWRVIAAWVVAAVAAVVLAGASGGALHDDFTMPGTDSQRATDLLRERFPAQTGATARVVVHSDSGPVDAAAIEAVRDRIEPLAHVQGVAPAVVSEDGRTAVLAVQYDVPVTDVEPSKAYDALEVAAAPARDAGLQTEFGGEVLDQIYEQGS